MHKNPFQYRRPERRIGPDLWTRALCWVGIAGWMIMLAVYVLLDRAKPERGTFIDTMYFEQLGIPVNVDSRWDMGLVEVVFYLMVLSLCVSIAGLLINATRRKRNDDGFRKYLVVLGLISVFGVVYYLI
ncbi:MAG: hypothetical protein KAS48_02955 [Gammaproteobacteria bacterium]|nr:hypothetical protein [Gammaproteobacteria bacterium]MCK5092421.1 hypothetical protein [Gammaproteobacteria bacterium]